MRREGAKVAIKKITEGVLKEVVDLTLWYIAYLGASTVNFSRTTWQSRVAADRFVEEVNYESIKNALEYLRKKGFVKRGNHKKAWPQVTAEGKKRLESILPQYIPQRTWDGKIYLLTYDIPEKRKKDRELVRKFARRLGMGMLQESVWITPYNPRDILADFIAERHLQDTIIISDIGKDGTIGEEDLKSLVSRVYKLDRLNDLYRDYISDVESGHIRNPIQKQFGFLSILTQDPQLPRDLLPKDWMGNKAFQSYMKVKC